MFATIVMLLAVLLLFKWMFWSGPHPPNRGWTKRQLARMDQGKSPWTLWCWITYCNERGDELRGKE